MTDGLSVAAIPAKVATALVVRHHYLHRRPPISFAYGLIRDGWPVGTVTFGVPASRHLQMGACPSDPRLVIELNRLWVSDDEAANTESWFVSRALRILPARIVVSYADTREGHYGYVYRALNFRYAGWTDMERKTPRFDYIPTSGGHTRDAFRGGYTDRVRRLPKVKYWTATGNRTERRRLTGLCAWPTLSWIDTPPPFLEGSA